MKPLYRQQRGAVVTYNGYKPGRPSRSYHSYMLAGLRLVLAVEVAGEQPTYVQAFVTGLGRLLNRLARKHPLRLPRGGDDLGNEPAMRKAEQRLLPYLFKLPLTNRLKRAIERAMDDQDWQEEGAGWQGKDGQLRLHV